MTDLLLCPADTIAKLEAIPKDLQEVIGRTAWIENQLRHVASLFPHDRAPQTFLASSNDFSADPAVVGGEIPIGTTVILAEYEVPEHRMSSLSYMQVTSRVIVALGAAVAQRIFIQLKPPSGSASLVVRSNYGFASTIGTQLNVVHDSRIILTPRWKILVGVETLPAGAGTLRAQGSIAGLEYNLAGA